MPAPLNAQAADQARSRLRGIDLPKDIRTATDHLAILRFTLEHAPDRLWAVEAACTQAEVLCAEKSEPSPEIRGLLEGAGSRGQPGALVSNNAERAVRRFFDVRGWADSVAIYACRTSDNCQLLKPNPYLVVAATRLLRRSPGDCVFIGDSVSDVEAGHGAGVPVVGLAKTRRRGDALRAAGANALRVRSDRP